MANVIVAQQVHPASVVPGFAPGTLKLEHKGASKHIPKEKWGGENFNDFEYSVQSFLYALDPYHRAHHLPGLLEQWGTSGQVCVKDTLKRYIWARFGEKNNGSGSEELVGPDHEYNWAAIDSELASVLISCTKGTPASIIKKALKGKRSGGLEETVRLVPAESQR